jgi:catechol 2,3-dioxygenase-like lactoylglutathione lyase family enzyme
MHTSGRTIASGVDQGDYGAVRLTGPLGPDSVALVCKEDAMKRTWTIIGVADVARSFQWYQSLFGQPPTKPAHTYFGQILDTDGTVLLCLHEWGSHDHPPLTSPDRGQPGNGLLLFFRVDDFQETLLRARALVTELAEECELNPSTGTEEFALRDPDGYYVMVSALAAPRQS